MSTLLREDAVLKLHTANDGSIWILDGKRGPSPTGNKSIESTISHSALKGRVVRVVGTASNAEMLLALFRMQQEGAIAGVQIAGPRAVCETSEERADPQVLLYRMRQCELPGSLGGWHAMTSADYTTYAIVSQLRRDGGVVTDHTRQLYSAHPVAIDLRFIDTLSMDAAARLIAEIIDPRFFIDQRFPNRVAKLKRYMGLAPHVQREVAAGMLATPQQLRCSIVLACWRESPALLTARNFLHRIYASAADQIRGEVKASQAFITYLHYTWLSRVTSHTTAGGEPLFDPALFFRRDDELAAYAMHARTAV